MKRKYWAILFFFALLSMLLVSFRYKILFLAGDALIVTNTIKSLDYAFVLSGGAKDRGSYTAELFEKGAIEHIVCTGANLSPDLESYGIEVPESFLTRKQILSLGVPSNNISMLPEGTSTYEESDAILSFCLDNGLKEIALVSSLFHTRRIAKVFLNKFEREGVLVRIYGAASSQYSEERWWESEAGLIAVNNEYIKLIYYCIKY